MVTLDRQDGASKLGAELAYPLLHTGKSAIYRLELHGQYVGPGGLGVYGQVPFAILRVDGSAGVAAETSSGVGNLELGGIYAIRDVGSKEGALVAHFGIMLPTANGLPVSGGTVANFGGAATRWTDLSAAAPRGLLLRGGISGLYRSGHLFGRVDLGVDVMIDDDNGQAFATGTVDPLIHFNFAGGYDGGGWAAMAEFVNLISTNSRMGQPNAFNTLAISGRLMRGVYEPYLALTFPLDEDAGAVIDAAFTIGLDHRM